MPRLASFSFISSSLFFVNFLGFFTGKLFEPINILPPRENSFGGEILGKSFLLLGYCIRLDQTSLSLAWLIYYLDF